MMEITRGSLDEITRPASGHNIRQRPGSRVSLNSAGSSTSSHRFNLNTETSLEILPPEDISQEAHDIEVEEFSSGSEGEDDQLSGIQNGSSHDHRLILRHNLGDDDSEQDTASVDTDDPNINSSTNDRGRANHGSANNYDNPNGVGTEEDPDDGVDPKIVAAMRKMRQLDRILAKRIKREKEVKRQRLDLHRQLQRELDGVKPEGRDELKEVSENTTKFLALIPPSSHNEGVDAEDDLPSVSPVFATQPLEGDGSLNSGRGGQRSNGNDTGRDGGDGQSTDRSGPRNGSDDLTGSGKKGNKKNKKSKSKRAQDGKDGDKDSFIRRNIELATDAGNVIAMTDDEKKRLEELLQEVEMLHDDEEEEAGSMPPNQLQLAPGIGYLPDASEQRTLQDIDAKLMALMPSEDFLSICSTPIQESARGGFSDTSSEMFNLGEKVLIDTKQARAQQDRLQRIEDDLARMQTTVEQEIKSPRISKERLAEILRQCDDLSSRATSEASSYIRSSTTTSPRNDTQTETPSDMAIVEVPKLPDDVLRHLLDEAREAGITSDRTSGGMTSNRSLSTVNEGEEEEEDLQSGAYTGRSSQAGALVSYDMIQELLKNPRATSVASTEEGEYPRSATSTTSPRLTNNADQMSPRDSISGSRVSPRSGSVTPRSVNGTRRTPVLQSPRSSSRGLPKSSYSGDLDNDYHLQDQRSSSNFGHNRSLSPYGLRPAQVTESSDYMDTDDLQTRFAGVSLENNSAEGSPIDPRLLLKTRGSSRIAFAEPGGNSHFDQNISSNMANLRAGQSGDISRSSYRIPTPPQISQSPAGPQKSKTPSSSRRKKSKSRTPSRQKTPAQSRPSVDQDLRVESVSASASYTSMTDRTDSQASENTLVSSSDFEYEDDDEVQQQVLDTPGDVNDDILRRMASARQRSEEDKIEHSVNPGPVLPRLQAIRGSRPKPVLPVDKQKIQGIENYGESDDDSDKPFSPVFF